MIRYNISDADIIRRIDAEKTTWRDRAKTKTDHIIATGKYDLESAIWSEIKSVFMDLQFNKCIFCERDFEDKKYGKIEHDLEHFRPKGGVKSWPRIKDDFTYTYSTGSANDNGYYWLAYDIGNYAASCKTCNSVMKSNCFPIASARKGLPANIADLTRIEKPFLCYPIGGVDSDPEDLITFNGTIAIPNSTNTHEIRRATIIIDFFRLNRDKLHKHRAEKISLMGYCLTELRRGERVIINQGYLEQMLADSAPHAACSRAFYKLWLSDNTAAQRIRNKCQEVSS